MAPKEHKIKIIDDSVLKTKNKKYDKLLEDHIKKDGDKLDMIKILRRKDGTIQIFESYYKKGKFPTVKKEVAE